MLTMTVMTIESLKTDTSLYADSYSCSLLFSAPSIWLSLRPTLSTSPKGVRERLYNSNKSIDNSKIFYFANLS